MALLRALPARKFGAFSVVVLSASPREPTVPGSERRQLRRRMLKSDPRTAPIPVVAFTARAVTTAQMNLLRQVTDGYIQKPCHPSEFLKAVEQWIGPSRIVVIASRWETVGMRPVGFQVEAAQLSTQVRQRLSV